MQNWATPTVEKFNAKQLSKIIKAKAWSVSSAMDVGEFLDNANVGMSGTVYMDFNPGHAIQVEVIGRVIIGGYLIITLITSSGDTYTYNRPESGGVWQRV